MINFQVLVSICYLWVNSLLFSYSVKWYRQLMYIMSFVHLCIKPRQTCQRLGAASYRKLYKHLKTPWTNIRIFHSIFSYRTAYILSANHDVHSSRATSPRPYQLWFPRVHVHRGTLSLIPHVQWRDASTLIFKGPRMSTVVLCR